MIHVIVISYCSEIEFTKENRIKTNGSEIDQDFFGEKFLHSSICKRFAISVPKINSI